MLRGICQVGDTDPASAKIVCPLPLLKRWGHVSRIHLVQRVQMEDSCQVDESFGSERHELRESRVRRWRGRSDTVHPERHVPNCHFESKFEQTAELGRHQIVEQHDIDRERGKDRYNRLSDP